jgi:hypothetical protein
LEAVKKHKKIFNIDETGFCLKSKPLKVVSERKLIQLTSESVSVVACYNAS